MKNKIISWLLLASMFLTLFLTSCSDVDTGYEEETTTIPDITLTLYTAKIQKNLDTYFDTCNMRRACGKRNCVDGQIRR